MPKLIKIIVFTGSFKLYQNIDVKTSKTPKTDVIEKGTYYL